MVVGCAEETNNCMEPMKYSISEAYVQLWRKEGTITGRKFNLKTNSVDLSVIS
jgi:hypothetical protein